MFQLNVKNVFLYGNLKEVYMEQLSGYVTQGENMVCKIKKAIYDVKQSPRAWFGKLICIISEVGSRSVILNIQFSL